MSTYQTCFPPLLTSAVVKWAKEHVDAFNAILARQLSSVEKGSEVWEQCVEQAKAHAGMLMEVGLDFREQVGRGVSDDDETALKNGTSNGSKKKEAEGLGLQVAVEGVVEGDGEEGSGESEEPVGLGVS